MNADQLYEVIRGFGYTTHAQSREIANALAAPTQAPEHPSDCLGDPGECAYNEACMYQCQGEQPPATPPEQASPEVAEPDPITDECDCGYGCPPGNGCRHSGEAAAVEPAAITFELLAAVSAWERRLWTIEDDGRDAISLNDVWSLLKPVKAALYRHPAPASAQAGAVPVDLEALIVPLTSIKNQRWFVRAEVEAIVAAAIAAPKAGAPGAGHGSDA